jgi:hypothetical protein
MLAKESGADVIEAALNSNSPVTLTPTQFEEPALATSNNRKGNNQ